MKAGKITASALVLLMLLPVFAACSESEGNTDTPAGGSQTAFDPSAAMEKNLKSV